jgi:hypothetical protein
MGGGPTEPGAGLGQVELQRPGAVVGDPDQHLIGGNAQIDLELGARVQRRVVTQLAGQQQYRVHEVVLAGLVQAGLGHGAAQHGTRPPRGRGVGWKPELLLQPNWHASSLPTPRRDGAAEAGPNRVEG